MNTYEFDGEKYKKASKHQKEWGTRLISELQWKGNETVLDLGCGDGVLTAELAKLVPDGRVLGIDSSEGMIRTAEQYAGGNLQFRRMDIREMDFRDSFDVLFSNAALHWIKDHKSLLKKAYCACKPGGVILWNFAADGNCATFFAVVRQKMSAKKYSSYFKHFDWPWYMPDKTDYEALIRQAGFSKFQIREENADRYFADAAEMIKWIDQPSLVPFLGLLPEDRKAEFREEVIRAMLDKAICPDGRCFEYFRRIQVMAEK